MKSKLYIISFILLLSAGFCNLSAQNTILEYYSTDGVVPPIIHPDTGVSCSGGPGSEIHDDGTYENAYGVPDDSCRYVIKMRPSVYPWNYLSLCLAFTRISTGFSNLTFDIIVYDTLGAGGSPGNLKAIFTNKSAPGINIFPAYTSYRFTFLNIPAIFSGAYYIGIRYHNNPSTGIFLAQDESPGTPLWPGYQGTGNGPTWIPTQNGAGNQSYRCSAIRSEGIASVIPLCEQFESATFPPAGWSLAYTGTLYWSRVVQSGFGIGSGSAKYDFWNAPNGTNQSLISIPFSPTNIGDTLVFDEAFQPYTGAPDSLIILTSTDNGAIFTPLVRLGPPQLGTTTGNPSPYIPAANQWAKRKYVLPSGTNKIQFLGKSGFGDNMYIDSICTIMSLVGIGHNSNTIPAVYTLSQNYPNPFNPSTTISFELPKAGNVKLVIFDILGREVKTLVNDNRNAGSYTVLFDASALASGIYFYQIESGDFKQTKKMLLVK